MEFGGNQSNDRVFPFASTLNFNYFIQGDTERVDERISTGSTSCNEAGAISPMLSELVEAVKFWLGTVLKAVDVPAHSVVHIYSHHHMPVFCQVNLLAVPDMAAMSHRRNLRDGTNGNMRVAFPPTVVLHLSYWTRTRTAVQSKMQGSDADSTLSNGSGTWEEMQLGVLVQ